MVKGLRGSFLIALFALMAMFSSPVWPLPLHEPIRQSETAQPAQEGDDTEASWVAPMTLATLGLVFATLILVGHTLWLARHTRHLAWLCHVLERGCVALSHQSPGLCFGPPQVSMEARNAGRTPATLTEMLVEPRIGRLPSEPIYRRPERDRRTAFLIAGKSAYFKELLVIKPATLALVRAGKKRLYLVGYVDYIDTFGERRRNGYARLYDPLRDVPGGDNLVFVAEGEWNYDRPRTRDEGNDWKQKT